MSTTMVSHLNEAAAILVLQELNFFLLSTLSWVAINLHSRSPRKWKRSLGFFSFYILFTQCRLWDNRAIFVRPWNENARTKQKQQTNGNRAIWLVYRTDTNARGFWLVKRTLGWKNFMPENFLEINRYFALTSYCNTIGQSNNAFSILGFSLAGKRRGHVLIFSSTGW